MKQKNADVIIIQGAPGVGKSTTGKKLATYFPQGTRLEADTLRSMVITPDWKKQSEHIKLLEVVAKLTLEFLGLNFSPVIVIDTFSGNKAEKFREDLRQLNPKIRIVSFGLFCSEETLRKRVDFRSDEEFKDIEVCLKLNRVVIRQKNTETIYVDSTLLSPEETAQQIFDGLMKSSS
jgi:adenylate kinase family enzyme